MDHLIPTILGLAGALAPVAFAFLRQEQPVLARVSRPARLAPARSNGATLDGALIRGGRVYL